jgi:outer membrane lipoprotein-sorting protein
MRIRILAFFIALASAGVGASAAFADDGAALVRASQDAFNAAGSDFRAEVTMRLTDAQGRARNRRLVLLRLNEPEGRQWYYLYFKEPADVRGMAFLVHKYPNRDDDRWLFVPAVDLVRRIAARDARSSFAGSDFQYEDISGRDVALDDYRVLPDSTINGRRARVVEATPRSAAEYARKVSHIDAENKLPLREEYFDGRGRLLRRFIGSEIRSIDGRPTITVRTMEDLVRGSRTVVTLENVRYNANIPSTVFAERSLREPPRQWF